MSVVWATEFVTSLQQLQLTSHFSHHETTGKMVITGARVGLGWRISGGHVMRATDCPPRKPHLGAGRAAGRHTSTTTLLSNFSPSSPTRSQFNPAKLTLLF